MFEGSGSIRAGLASARCLAGRLPLFFRAAPRTPLRVLGIIALDTLHVLRHGRALPAWRVEAIALFLDFAAGANAAWDHKRIDDTDQQRLRRQLDRLGLTPVIDQHLDRLARIESRRPAVGAGFVEVQAYREAVAALSLGTATALALELPLDAGVHATGSDPDIAMLFRILMQCQIIDDVLDYPEDAAAGLPSFLTGSVPVLRALEQATAAARVYSRRAPVAGTGIFPLRVSMLVLTTMVHGLLRLARWRYRRGSAVQPARTAFWR